jgi:ABC-type multidrug transport system fused ATPase/permease subunit
MWAAFNGDLKIIFWFFKSYKIKVFLIFLFLLIYSVLETISIGAFYPLLNNALSIDGSETVVGGKVLGYIGLIVKKLPVEQEIVAASIFLLSMVLTSTFFGFFAESFATWYRYKLFADFLNRIYRKFLSNHYHFFLGKKQGDLLYIGMNASQSVGEMLLYFPRIGREFFRIMIISIFLLTISVKVTLAVFIVTLMFGGIIHYLSTKVIYPVAVNLQKAHSDITSVFSESMQGIRQIKILDNSGLWGGHFSRLTHRARMLSTKNVVASYIPSRLIIIMAAFAIGLSVVYVKLRFPQELNAFLPIIGVYILALQRLMPSISSIGHHWMGLKGLAPRLSVTHNTLIDESFTVEDGKKEFTGLQSEIRFEDVSFSYPSRRHVLRNINIGICKNQTVAIVGESGCGKSTLADLLVRLYEPETGRILINGVNYREFIYSSWIKHIALVSQDTFIFHTTVLENISMGKPDATEEGIVNAAKIAHAHQFIMDLPDKYNTILGDRGIKLSGGQRQRIAIARTVIRNPDILILDEATNSLDNISDKIVRRALKEAMKDRTTIIIAHRLSTIEHADKIILMRKGEVVEQGTHGELLGARGYYYSLYWKQKGLSSDWASQEGESTDVQE